MARDGTAVIRASDRVGQRGGGRAENLGFLDSGRKIPIGVELPIRVDRRGRIEIDHGRMDPTDAEAARATLGEG